MARCRESELAATLRPLGLFNVRARGLRRLANVMCRGHAPIDAEDVLRFPACGQYAADAWAIFMEGRRDLSPTDGMLAMYLEDTE